VEPDAALLRDLLGDPQEELRATALVILVATGELSGEEAESTLETFTKAGVPVRRALARAAGELQGRPTGSGGDLLEKTVTLLARDADVETRSLAATAMGRLRAPAFTEVLFEVSSAESVGEPGGSGRAPSA
jgi:hypothetical protein